MLTEIEILEQYFSELERLWPTTPDLIKSVDAFEAWEQSCRPKAFETAGPALSIESDLVIISYVRSNRGKGIGFVDNLNRINVAHTRCRRAIAIVGDLERLKRQAGTDVFVRMERAFARDGEIVDIDGELFGQMSSLA